ncbi:3-oxoadipate enol-lactonase, partial [Acinetobacter baumannii]
VADAEFMQKAINNSQLAKLEASHLSNIEQPQRFTQELTRFIQQI